MQDLKTAHFDGPVYEPKFDFRRLSGQIRRVFTFMLDGQWHTLKDIAKATGDPTPSISAQLRHLRKEKFGAFIIQKRPHGERSNGLWEYRLDVDQV